MHKERRQREALEQRDRAERLAARKQRINARSSSPFFFSTSGVDQVMEATVRQHNVGQRRGHYPHG